MTYRFFTCDVFTEQRFGGNPLAVLPDANGLTAAQMQRIAREFNYSETTFVLPAEQSGDYRVRIFTPVTEIPFAGHPNIGTAFTLAEMGAFGTIESERPIVFEETAGLVHIAIRRLPNGQLECELEAPKAFEAGPNADTKAVAAAISLDCSEIVVHPNAPQIASVGIPFTFVELRSLEALSRARPYLPGFEALQSRGLTTMLHLYWKNGDSPELQTRMFAPLQGVVEDPATGSANCALAGLLAHRSNQVDGMLSWSLHQGVEMGRPSIMHARAEKRSGTVARTWIGGRSVSVASGTIEVGSD